MSSPSPSHDSCSQYRCVLSNQPKCKRLITQRKQRIFVPDNKKDDSYWDHRRRNNEASKLSREKKRLNYMALEQRVVDLTKENNILKAQVELIKDKYNISGENLVSLDQTLVTVPISEKVLSITERAAAAVFNTNTILPNNISIDGINNYSSSSAVSRNIITKQQSTPKFTAALASSYVCYNSTNNNSNNIVLSVLGQRANEQYHDLSTQSLTSQFKSNQIIPSSHHRFERTTFTSNFEHLHNRTAAINNMIINPNSINSTSPYDNILSSSTGTVSDQISSDDEHDTLCDISSSPIDLSNSLPLKLRHKYHLGHKDAVVTALLEIQKKTSSLASPPCDVLLSNDERYSDISIGTAEWTLDQHKVRVPNSGLPINDREDTIYLKTQLLARLESEVANIKNMMILSSGTGCTTNSQ